MELPSVNQLPHSAQNARFLLNALPIKRFKRILYHTNLPQKKIPHHTIAVGLIVNKQGELLIALRPNDAMLGGLWEFPGGKKKKKESIKETVKRELNEELDITVRVHSRFNILKHAYSHFKITLHAYWCSISHGAPSAKSSQEIKWVALNEIDQYPFPKANKTLVNGLQNMSHYELIKKVES